MFFTLLCIAAPPRFINTEVDLNIVLSVGQSESLDCAAAGAPFPNVTWSVRLHSQSAQDLPWTNSTLDVQLSNESETGEYICSVNNGVATVTRTFTLKLASKLRVFLLST